MSDQPRAEGVEDPPAKTTRHKSSKPRAAVPEVRAKESPAHETQAAETGAEGARAEEAQAEETRAQDPRIEEPRAEETRAVEPPTGERAVEAAHDPTGHELAQRLIAREPSAFWSIWRTVRWGVLAVVLVAVTVQVSAWFERSMQQAKVGGNQATASSTTSPLTGATPAQPGQRIKVVIQGLNLRTQPSIGGGVIIRKLPKGLSLELVASKPGWFYVKTADGTKGWVVNRKGYSQLEE